MEDWQTALMVAAIAAIAAVVGALIGRERWPADLRDAKRLGEIVDKMEPGSEEREFAAKYRDDLAARWIIRRVVASNDIRREIGLTFILAGFVLLLVGGVGAAVALSGALMQTPLELVTGWPAWLGCGLAFVGVGVWCGNAYLKHWDHYLKELRTARGMREPVTSWVNDFNRAYRGRKPVKTPTAAPEAVSRDAALPEQD